MARRSTPRLVLLWHLHQPLYKDLIDDRYALPFAGLHATRSYYDMVQVLQAHPGVRVVLNFAPVLLDQLVDYAQGRAVDPLLDAACRPAEALTEVERLALMRDGFTCNRELRIRPSPRYSELLARRGPDRARHDPDMASVAASSSSAELRDLQVHFLLAWTGFAARAEEPVFDALAARDRGFTASDHQDLVAARQRVLGRVIPALSAAARSGQIEVATSPYCHPILPLLIDTQSARRALPDHAMPPPFRWPDDARAQLVAARPRIADLLGVTPVGLWPSEGAVGPEVAALAAEAGFRWLASDGGVLDRSRRDDAVNPHRAWHIDTATGPLVALFRHTDLSDRIGFRYQRLPAHAAADDFVTTVERLARDGADLVTVALDGENPWDGYPEFGRAFLGELYRALGARVETVLPRAIEPRSLPRIHHLHTGSWIGADLRIWMGHAETHAAWGMLAVLRSAIDAAGAAGRDEKVRRALMAAEGSDWFWWFGDDFHSEFQVDFDRLFRRHVEAAWRALGRTPPADVLLPVRRAARTAARPATAIMRPEVERAPFSYRQWLGAGSFHATAGDGAMAVGRARVTRLMYGGDGHALYVRVALDGPSVAAVEVRVQPAGGGEATSVRVPVPRVSGEERRDVFVRVGVDPHVARPGEDVLLQVAVLDEAGREIERVPGGDPLRITLPDRDVERRYWQV